MLERPALRDEQAHVDMRRQLPQSYVDARLVTTSAAEPRPTNRNLRALRDFVAFFFGSDAIVLGHRARFNATSAPATISIAPLVSGIRYQV